MKKTLFIFDIDDTLTQSAAIHIECFIESLNELGVEKMDTNFGEYLHHTDSYIAKTIYEKELWQTFTEQIKAQFEKLLTNKMADKTIVEVPGASLFLKELRKNLSVAICFATGSLRRPAIQKLQAIGVDFEDQLLVASDRLSKRESIVKNAIAEAKKFYQADSFERIISFGDGLWDLKVSENVGLEFVGIGEKNKLVLLENGCLKHFDDFQALTYKDVLN
ncbi:MAG: phosphoglycolate phosphatase-like HAD superfamily hydrolase [Vicingaceae bacterium]|jgi:phosphoglycolate phosphatase-like HAD superfamily hydrolase